MKDLERMFDRAVEIINECIDGVEIYPVNRPITINTRAKSRWGCMKYNRRTGERKIEISSRILADSVPDNATMSTIIHEILHACKGCKGHQGQWKRYANAVNAKYPQFNIERTTNAEYFGLEDTRETEYKFAVRCVSCGHYYYRRKLTEVIKHPENYHCKCGGRLESLDLRLVTPPIEVKPYQLCLMDL